MIAQPVGISPRTSGTVAWSRPRFDGSWLFSDETAVLPVEAVGAVMALVVHLIEAHRAAVPVHGSTYSSAPVIVTALRSASNDWT